MVAYAIKLKVMARLNGESNSDFTGLPWETLPCDPENQRDNLLSPMNHSLRCVRIHKKKKSKLTRCVLRNWIILNLELQHLSRVHSTECLLPAAWQFCRWQANSTKSITGWLEAPLIHFDLHEGFPPDKSSANNTLGHLLHMFHCHERLVCIV